MAGIDVYLLAENWLSGWSAGWLKVVEGWFFDNRKCVEKQSQPWWLVEVVDAG